jgi:hypothetical protein
MVEADSRRWEKQSVPISPNRRIDGHELSLFAHPTLDVGDLLGENLSITTF